MSREENEPAARATILARPYGGEQMPLLQGSLGGGTTTSSTPQLQPGFESALETVDPSAAAPDGGVQPPSQRLSSYTSEPPRALLLTRQFAKLEAARLGLEHVLQAQPSAGGASEHSLPHLATNGSVGEAGGPLSPGPSARLGLARDDLAVGGSQGLMPARSLPPLSSQHSLGPVPLTAPGNPQPSPSAPHGAVSKAVQSFRPLRSQRQHGPAQAQQLPQQHGPERGRRRLGVHLLADPRAEQRGVANHKLAGDLFLAPQPGSAGGFKVPPLPPDMTADVLRLDRRTRATHKSLKRSRKIERSDSKSDDEDEEEMDLYVDLPEEGRAVPLYRKAKFWKAFISLIFTAAFTVAGILMALWQEDERVEGWFQWWRLLIFIATWMPIWWTGSFLGRAITWATGRHFFNHNTFYFLHTVRKPLVNVFRASLLLASWAATMFEPSFNERDEPGNETINKFYNAYIVILKLLGCLGLFFATELVKVLLAKMISQKFNRESHIEKMQDALRKERYLHALLQARPSSWKEAGDFGDDYQHGDDPMAGPPNLHRASAPQPSQPMHSLRSLLGGLTRPWLGQSGSDVGAKTQGLDPITEKEEKVDEVVIDMEPPSEPTAPSKRFGSGVFHLSPKRGPAGPVEIVSPTMSSKSLLASTKKAGDGMQGIAAVGVLRQRSQAVGALQKKGTQSARALSTRNAAGATEDSFAHGGMNKTGLRSASAVAPTRSTLAGRQSAADQAAARMNAEMLQTESTQSLLRTGQGQIAAKMARVEKHLRKKNLQITVYDELSSTHRLAKVTSEVEAKRLAFYLFYNVKADFDRSYIVIEDLEAFMSEKEAQGAFKMLDRNGNGKVSLAECASAVMQVFSDREYLAKSLKDMKNIVGKLAFMIGIGLHVFMFIIYLFLLGVNGWKVFAAGVPILTALSFALGSVVKNAFDSSVFLFVTHPYDIGDTIIFNDNGYRVEEISLACTVLLRTADSARIYYPNQMLINTPIHNVTTSPEFSEVITFIVDACTPYSVLEELKLAVAKLVAERPQDYNGKCSAWFELLKDPQRPNRLGLKMKIDYACNQLSPRCLPARGAMCHMLLSRLAELKVDVTNVVQPVFMQQGAGPVVPSGSWPQ